MKLASFEKITQLIPHPNADRLDLVKILGFQCVTQKGLYKEGDEVIFVQPDTILPDSEWAVEYKKYSPKRIKAIKLRGEFSEGVIIPLSLVNEFFKEIPIIGQDCSHELGIIKYDPPVPQDLDAIGFLPYGIGQTDEERWENIENIPFGEIVDLTLKVDGQSCTYYYNVNEKKFGVCGRKLEFKPESSNNYTLHIPKIKDKLINFCEENNVSLAIRGESYGQGIQSGKHNPHSKLSKSFACFSVFNI